MLAAGRVDQLHSPGVTHLTLLDEPHAGEIAEILSRHIAEADAPEARPARPPAGPGRRPTGSRHPGDRPSEDRAMTGSRGCASMEGSDRPTPAAAAAARGTDRARGSHREEGNGGSHRRTEA